jgi:hypothetical protein
MIGRNRRAGLRGRAAHVLRYAWASPASLVGLSVAAPTICGGATIRLVDGVLEVAGGPLLGALQRMPPSARFVAITLGHVIVGIDHDVLQRSRDHEHVHVQQYERLGVLFFPLYLAAGAWAALRGRRAYLDNPFEREAFARTATPCPVPSTRVSCSPPRAIAGASREKPS